MGQGPHCDAPCQPQTGPQRLATMTAGGPVPHQVPKLATHPIFPTKSGPAATCRALPLVLEPPQHGPGRAGCLAAG